MSCIGLMLYLDIKLYHRHLCRVKNNMLAMYLKNHIGT